MSRVAHCGRPLGAALIDGRVGEPAAERDQSGWRPRPRRRARSRRRAWSLGLVVAAVEEGVEQRHVGERAADHDRGNAGAGQRPAVLALDEDVGLVRRCRAAGPSPSRSRRSAASSAGECRGRAPPPARRRGAIATVSMLIAATIEASGTGGCAAKYSAPSRPISSAVVARNRMSRTGRGPLAEPAGDLDHHRDAARIVDRAVADPVGVAFRPADAEMVPMGEEQQALAGRRRCRAAGRRHCCWCSADRRSSTSSEARSGSATGAEGRARLLVEQPLEIAAGRRDQALRRRGMRHAPVIARHRRRSSRVVPRPTAGGDAAPGHVGADDRDHRRRAGLGQRPHALGERRESRARCGRCRAGSAPPRR